MKNTLVKICKWLWVALSIVTLVLVVLRARVALLPFTSQPNHFHNQDIPPDECQKVIDAIIKDDPGNLAPCSFTFSSFFGEFIGIKSHILEVGVSKNADGEYEVFINRGNDDKDRCVIHMIFDSDYTVLTKYRKRLCF